MRQEGLIVAKNGFVMSVISSEVMDLWFAARRFSNRKYDALQCLLYAVFL